MPYYTYGDYVYLNNSIDSPKKHHNKFILNQGPDLKSLSPRPPQPVGVHWGGLGLRCINIPGHALMGRPPARLETMSLVISSYVLVCIVGRRR